MGRRFGRIPAVLALFLAAAAAGEGFTSLAAEFPEPNPSSRSQASGLLADQRGLTPVARRALAYLQAASDDRARTTVAGVSLLDLSAAGSAGTAPPAGSPLIAVTARALEEARGLLVDRLGLPEPEGLEIVQVETLGISEAYSAPRRGAPRTLVIEASAAEDPAATRQIAIRHYARAVARSSGALIPEGWAEALGQWTRLVLDGGPDESLAGQLSARLDRLGEGLDPRDPRLFAGNAAWFAFVHHAYGPWAVRLTVEELGRTVPAAAALERALARASGVDLATAFREFHLWSLLRGARADGFHFPFAPLLASPSFTSSTSTLPELSVHADPPLAPWGAAQIRIVPEGQRGGLEVEFEGEFGARWEADLLLTSNDGSVRRLGLPCDGGRAAATVPLDGLAEAILLVRNLGGEDAAPRRYAYAAHRQPGYPFDLSALEVQEVPGPDGGVLISWETSTEQDVLGFNVLRYAEGAEQGVTLNPISIPALGGSAYRYLDRGTAPDGVWVYRIQGVTAAGLASLSDPVSFRHAGPRTRR